MEEEKTEGSLSMAELSCKFYENYLVLIFSLNNFYWKFFNGSIIDLR